MKNMKKKKKRKAIWKKIVVCDLSRNGLNDCIFFIIIIFMRKKRSFASDVSLSTAATSLCTSNDVAICPQSRGVHVNRVRGRPRAVQRADQRPEHRADVVDDHPGGDKRRPERAERRQAGARAQAGPPARPGPGPRDRVRVALRGRRRRARRPPRQLALHQRTHRAAAPRPPGSRPRRRQAPVGVPSGSHRTSSSG